MDLVPKQEQHKEEEEEEKEEEKEGMMILAEHGSRANFGGGGRRSEIKEVDFFSTGGARRRNDGDGDGEDGNREAGALGRGNTTVNVSLFDPDELDEIDTWRAQLRWPLDLDTCMNLIFCAGVRVVWGFCRRRLTF